MDTAAAPAVVRHAPIRQEWLALQREDILEPALPIVDPHHHLWDRPHNRYFLPDHLKTFPRCHCQIRWKDAQGNDLKIAGPIAIGGGKYAGLGLFAAPST